MAAAAAGKQPEKEPVNIVHQNAIFRETVHKEQRHQKLYTDYGVNPYKKSKMQLIIQYQFSFNFNVLIFLIICICVQHMY